MKISTLWASATAMVLLAGCSGGSITPPASPSSAPIVVPQSGAVAFTVIAPQNAGGGSTIRRPNFTAPTNTASVSFTVVSVNGSATTGSHPTVANISSTSPGCSGTTTVTCTITASAPVGDVVFNIKTYTQANAGGSVNGSGSVDVTLQAGTTVVATTTLSGTVAKIALSAGTAPLGVAATVPIVVNAMDASGNTIIGTYGKAITLTDSDSAHTQLSKTSVSDSTSAASLTLAYDGKSVVATIGASASGVTPSNVTPVTFKPSGTYPTVNGATITTQQDTTVIDYQNGLQSGTYSYSNSIAAIYATGQTYAGVSDAVSVTDAGSPSNAYYEWLPLGSSVAFGYLGYTFSVPGYVENYTCDASAPPVSVMLPSAAFDGYAGSKPCVDTFVSAGGPFTSTANATINGDGSYSYLQSSTTPFGPVTATYESAKDGTITYSSSTSTGSEVIVAPAPSPNASLMSFTIQSFPGPIPSPGTTATPAPISTTAPNPYKLDPMFANATAQSPLQTDKFVPVNTAPTVLPAACVVPVSVLPATGAHLSEVTETYFESDMLYGWNGSSRYSTNHYYLDGVGEVCAIANEHHFSLDDFAGWMDGSDRIYSSSDYTLATYITAASLQAAMARTRSFANALPAASHALTAAVIANTRLRHQTHRPLHASAAVMRMLPPASPGR